MTPFRRSAALACAAALALAASAAAAQTTPRVDQAALAARQQQIAAVGARIDAMQNEATRLMSSPDRASHARGQQLMQQSQQLMQATIQSIAQEGAAAQTAVGGGAPRSDAWQAR